MPEKEYDYYKALQDQNYNTLLDKEIQLDSARQRALKNTNTNLAAAGFNSSGYGQTAKFGIENQYLQGLQNAEAQYQEQNRNIQNDKYNAMNDAYTGLFSDLSSADINSTEELNKYLTDYGLMKDGVLDQEAFNSRYGADNFARFNATIGNLNSQFEQASMNGSPISYNVNEARTNITDNDGNSNTLNDEIGFLFGSGNSSIPAQNGVVVMVKQNDTDGAKYAYLEYRNGGWQQIDSETYNKASNENKYELYSDKNTKDKYNVKHNGKSTKYNSHGGDLETETEKDYRDLPQEVKDYMKKNGLKENPAGGIWSWTNRTIEYNGYVYELPTYGNEIKVTKKGNN